VFRGKYFVAEGGLMSKIFTEDFMTPVPVKLVLMKMVNWERYPPRTPPKRGLFNLIMNIYEIIHFDYRGE
jgi:hypothetical protein